MSDDKKFKGNLSCRFDLKNQFINYADKANLHEAGYDAHMTGMIFMHIVKWKEIELAQKSAAVAATSYSSKNKAKKQSKKKSAVGALKVNSIRNRPIVLDDSNKFLSFHANKVMKREGMQHHFLLEPHRHKRQVEEAKEKHEFESTIYVEFEGG